MDPPQLVRLDAPCSPALAVRHLQILVHDTGPGEARARTDEAFAPRANPRLPMLVDPVVVGTHHDVDVGGRIGCDGAKRAAVFDHVVGVGPHEPVDVGRRHAERLLPGPGEVPAPFAALDAQRRQAGVVSGKVLEQLERAVGRAGVVHVHLVDVRS